MKRVVLSIISVSFCIFSFTQVPESFSYQAIVREGGATLSDQSVYYRFSIIKGELPGEVVYTEKHNPTTSEIGLVTLAIGKGTDKSGVFTAIGWGADIYSLNVELDLEGDGSYADMGTTQLLSVPYAMHSKTATNYAETDPLFGGWNKSTGINITASQVSDFQTSVTDNAAVLANTAKNSYPTADATKLAGIAEGAEVNVNADWDATTGDAQILNKPTTIEGYGITDAVITSGNQIISGDKTFINKILVTQQGIGTDMPDASAALEINSTTQGFLLPRMTEAQMYALTPVEGLIVYNTTSKNLNFYGDGKWYEFTSKICVPEPTTANAGSDQEILVTTTVLTGNAPVYGTGTWTIIAGTGGSIADIHNPTSVFTGIFTGYILQWTISTPCNTSTDNVNITFGLPCSNGIMDGTESDIDCGGSCGHFSWPTPLCCGQMCAAGLHCVNSSDCQSGVCTGVAPNRVCQVPTCTDYVFNGDEGDRDCGGSCTSRCADTKMCNVASDCASGVCTGHICKAATCSDGAQNGTETDIDCGGSCIYCPTGKHCVLNSDCFSGNCSSGHCI